MKKLKISYMYRKGSKRDVNKELIETSLDHLNPHHVGFIERYLMKERKYDWVGITWIKVIKDE